MNKIFWGPEGLGDHIMISVVAENYFRQTGKKMNLCIPENLRDLFKYDPHIYTVPLSISRLHKFYNRFPTIFHQHFAQLTNIWISETNNFYYPPINMTVAYCLSAGLSGTVSVTPHIYLTEEEKKHGRYFEKNQIVLLCQGKEAYKTWDYQKAQILVNQLKGRYQFIQLGLKDDPLLHGAKDLRGSLNLREIAAVLHNSDLFVGPVGGLMHLARAVDCPSVILMPGAEDECYFDYDCMFVHADNECNYCRKNQFFPPLACPRQFQCTKDIPVEKVITAIEQHRSRKYLQKRFQDIPSITGIRFKELISNTPALSLKTILYSGGKIVNELAYSAGIGTHDIFHPIQPSGEHPGKKRLELQIYSGTNAVCELKELKQFDKNGVIISDILFLNHPSYFSEIKNCNLIHLDTGLLVCNGKAQLALLRSPELDDEVCSLILRYQVHGTQPSQDFQILNIDTSLPAFIRLSFIFLKNFIRRNMKRLISCPLRLLTTKTKQDL